MSSGSDRTTAFAAVSEAVWAVTIVDAAMVRYHPDAYDVVLADETRTDRRLIEESLAGLRFVRNSIPDEAAVEAFVEPGDGDEPGVMGWTWRPVARPTLSERPPRARAWETARYRAYQARLAGRPVGEVFERAAEFLERTAAQVISTGQVGASAAVARHARHSDR